MRAKSLVLLGAVLTGAATLTSLPAAAAGAGASVTRVSVDPGPHRVDGVGQTAAVGIAASILNAGGAIGRCPAVGWYERGVVATLERVVGGSPATVDVPLALSGQSGSVTSWQGTWRATSTRNGTWTLTRMRWCVPSTGDGVESYQLTRGEGRSTVVVGTHAPTVTSEGVPSVVPFGARQWVRYTYRASDGMPLAGWPVVVRFTSGDCLVTSGRVMTTDSLGRVAVPVYPRETTCVRWMTRPTADLPYGAELGLGQATRHEYYGGVSVDSAPSAVRVGRSLTVLGHVYPASGWVALQALAGRTWTNLGVARVRPSGRYTLVTSSLHLGGQSLRVVAQGGRGLAPTASRVVVVTGTVR